jgi:hypothetical protein
MVDAERDRKQSKRGCNHEELLPAASCDLGLLHRHPVLGGSFK